jgi:hypothetical protein
MIQQKATAFSQAFYYAKEQHHPEVLEILLPYTKYNPIDVIIKFCRKYSRPLSFTYRIRRRNTHSLSSNNDNVYRIKKNKSKYD